MTLCLYFQSKSTAKKTVFSAKVIVCRVQVLHCDSRPGSQSVTAAGPTGAGANGPTMTWLQREIRLSAAKRGCHLVTKQIESEIAQDLRQFKVSDALPSTLASTTAPPPLPYTTSCCAPKRILGQHTITSHMPSCTLCRLDSATCSVSGEKGRGLTRARPCLVK